MKGVLEALLHVLLPRTCAHCLEDLPRGDKGPLCASCFGKLQWIKPLYCVRCGLPIDGGAHCARCMGERFACARIRGALVFGPEVRSLVVKFKYGGRWRLAEPLGAWMAEALKAYPELEAEALVPAPLHPKRLRERGYNQALLLAERVARTGGLPVLEALRRVRSAKPQAELGREERLSNLSGAYEACLPVQGRRLLLIDDVGTTGTTLEECAKALRAAGAAEVSALVLARQPL